MAEKEGVRFLEEHFDAAVIDSIREAFAGGFGSESLMETLKFHLGAVIDGEESWGSQNHPMHHVAPEDKAKLMEIAEAEAQVQTDGEEYLDWLGLEVKGAAEAADPTKTRRLSAA